MTTLEKQVKEANVALAVKSAKLRELEVQVPALQKELATGKQALEASRAELLAARSAASDLEAKNTALIRQATASLSREGDLKQALNISRAESAKLDDELKKAKAGLAAASTSASEANQRLTVAEAKVGEAVAGREGGRQ